MASAGARDYNEGLGDSGLGQYSAKAQEVSNVL